MPQLSSAQGMALRACFAALLSATILGSEPVEESPPAPEKPPEPKIATQLIEERIRQVQDAEIDEAERSRAIDLYNQALVYVQDATAQVEATTRFEGEIAAAPAATEKARSDAEAFQDQAEVFIPAEVDVADLQQELRKLELRLEQEKRDHSDRVMTIKRRAERRGELAQLRVAARQQESEAADELSKLPEDDESPVNAAERLMWKARMWALGKTLTRYDREEEKIEAEQELLALQRDLRKRQIARTEEELQLWRDGVDRRRREEQEEQERLAQEQLRRAETFRASPAVRDLAERYRQLTELRDRSTSRITELTAQIDQTHEQLEDLRKSFEQSRERVARAGRTHAVGMLLRKQRAALPDLKAHRRVVAELQDEIQDAQLVSTELADRREELSDLEASTEAVLAELLLSPDGPQRAELGPFVLSMLEAERDLLDTLTSEYDGVYLPKLTSLDTEARLLTAETEKYAQYIGEHVLWIGSTLPIQFSTFPEAARAAAWLTHPSSWREVGRGLVRAAWDQPLVALLALALFVALCAWEPRVRERITELGAQASRSTASEFRPTVRTLALTAVVAAPWPALLGFLGWQLSSQLDAEGFVHAVGSGLTALALVYFPIELFREICRSRGLAESHFQWPASGVMVLRRNLRWAKYALLPLAFVTGVMHAQPNVRWQDSLGRLAFLAALLVVAECMRRVLRPHGGALSETIAYRKGSWIDRFRYVWYAAGVLTPLALAILAAVGYYYTASQLVVRLYATVWVALTLLIVQSLIARWALIARRRIAIEQLRQRREALAHAGGSEAVPSDVPDVPVDEGLDASAMSLQTRKLLHSILATAGAIGLWLVWIDVLPALSILEEVPVWSLTLDTTQEVPTADGATETRTVTHVVPITLADVTLAIIVLAVTVVCTRNIPGLLEMAVLQRLPLDAASRYATSTLARYAIVIVGLVTAFGVLGIGWQKVQWLAAAITLGLGFGLQEIFANFVSGLIILFERPVRVGDIVTVGEVTGVVSRIRMRATTITDWDRKEMIIPNKDLITGRVLNWTLSDAVNRITVTVGVAYGTDTDRVAQLLERIASQQERILDDPPPSVTFARFGESTLDFELRCFLSSMEHRGPVTHELHSTIHREFTNAGIEIAFPQREISIRSIGPAAQSILLGAEPAVRSGLSKAS